MDWAENGSEAVDQFEASDPGSYFAIFMDMQMPKLNGLEAVRQIRNFAGCGDLQIIAMTANAFAEDRERCLAAGMNDHLAKPVDTGELFAALVRWTGRTA